MSIQEKAKRYEWCSDTVLELREELDQVIAVAERGGASEPGIPMEPGGWWHSYVCPTHHTELLFDPLEEEAAQFVCPYGCEMNGEPYRGAWLVFKHQSLARYALQAAAVYAATGMSRYAELGRSIIVRYAEQFPHYPVHPDASPWMLKGRAFHQALTEAIWATTIIRAYLLLVDEGVSFIEGEDKLHVFFDMLESSMREYHGILTIDRGNPENNYTAWLNAALSCVYAARGEREKLLAQLDAIGGFRHHLSIAVKPDQLEFEGSIYYHAFVVRAYLISAEMAARFGEDLYSFNGEQGQTLCGMLSVLVQLADAEGCLPALHDGPYWREPYARELAEIFEIGLTHFSIEDCLPLLGEVYRQLRPQHHSRGGLEAVLYGTGDWRKSVPRDRQESVILPDSGFVVLAQLNNKLSCLLDFGAHGGSHGHYDKLNLMLSHRSYQLSPDRGTVPYGSPLKKEWYPHTACHNTVSIGGRSQHEAQGTCLKYERSEGYSYAWLRTCDAYDGAVLDRHVLINDFWVLDWFEVRLEEQEQVDWWFHYKGKLNSGIDEVSSSEQSAASAEPLGEQDGYSYIQEISRYNPASPLVYPLRIEQLVLPGEPSTKEVVSAVLWADAGASLIRVLSPGTADDPTQLSEGILHRQIGDNLRFIAVYCSGNQLPQLSWTESGELMVILNGEKALASKRYELTDNGLKERQAK
ncbi:heparinase [Paenibacillus sp. FSL H8-0548]|uniref:heparinase II/III domain-containing protein n=1 Tax=Paenibacillus sp. FSL H8-0548 TaxID=1920422 RepID=UPI00096EFB36|nr:heparinase II/III family protein [Paenibacillus sp. FSL H8-0548]OMF38068.1 heparinase [Paenibacillus sp. FSL H8-0548]